MGQGSIVAGSIVWQTGCHLLAFASAGVLATLAAKRHKQPAFGLLACTLFLDAALSLLSLIFFGWLLRLGSGWLDYFTFIQIPIRLLSLALMLLAWSLLAFNWKPSILYRSTQTERPPAPKPSRAGKITAVLVTLASLPSAAWAFIVLLACGMKTAPQMSAGEAFTGAVPALLLLLVLGGLMIFKEKLGLSLGYLITLALGVVVCTGTLFVMLMSCLHQP